VFGNERTGLEDQELALCNLASHIPSSDAFPSLNLSHAVQIYAYELFRALAEPAEAKGHWVPLDRTAIDDLVRQVSGSLERIGFYRQPGREAQERYFRDIFSRAGLTRREADYMEEIFSKAAWLAAKAASTKAATKK
jgi:tRNA/rRNA methyltransferase/tRNA (cytidine32/uridine32-2'-O)-methyltransferase